MSEFAERLDRARNRLRKEIPPRLAYTRKEAAEALGVSLSHFQRHIQPHLAVVYSGQLRLYPVEEVERWLRDRACKGGRAA